MSESLRPLRNQSAVLEAVTTPLDHGLNTQSYSGLHFNGGVLPQSIAKLPDINRAVTRMEHATSLCNAELEALVAQRSAFKASDSQAEDGSLQEILPGGR